MIAGSIDPTNVALIATEDLSMALEHKQSIPSIEKKKVTLS
jgi:hypothetical protein